MSALVCVIFQKRPQFPNNAYSIPTILKRIYPTKSCNENGTCSFLFKIVVHLYLLTYTYPYNPISLHASSIITHVCLGRQILSPVNHCQSYCGMLDIRCIYPPVLGHVREEYGYRSKAVAGMRLDGVHEVLILEYAVSSQSFTSERAVVMK